MIYNLIYDFHFFFFLAPKKRAWITYKNRDRNFITLLQQQVNILREKKAKNCPTYSALLHSFCKVMNQGREHFRSDLMKYIIENCTTEL